MSAEKVSPMVEWVKSHFHLFEKPAIFLLVGDLAAGKTTLVSHVVEAMQGKERVSSPTFALHHQYKTSSLTVDHMDLYRLKSDEDLASSGFYEVLEDSENLFFVEWANRLPLEVFKKNRPVYEIQINVDGDSRKIDFKQQF